jgi:hypothetical protein
MGYPAGAVLAPNGHIYVYDQIGSSIVVYDSTGHALRRIGRAGRGPGEFTSVHSLGLKGDTLWAYDGPLRRVTYLADEGSVLRVEQQPVDPPAIGDGRSFVLGFLSDRSVIVRFPRSTSRSLVFSNIIVRLAPFERTNGPAAVIDTITRLEQHNALIPLKGGQNGYLRHPWSAEDYIAIAPDGSRAVPLTLHGESEYTVASYSAERELFRRDFTVPPKPLPSASVDAWLDRTVAQKARAEGLSDANMRIQIREALSRSPTMPPASGIMLGRDGTTWIRREGIYPAEAAPDEIVSWDVLDSRGKIVATATVPAALDPFTATTSHVWGRRPDPEGVWRVERCQIERK